MYPSSAERYGAGLSATLSAYGRLNSALQTMSRYPFGLLGKEFYTNIISLTQKYDIKSQKYILNPKYTNSNNNYIPELLFACSVPTDGEFQFESYEHFGQSQSVLHN